MTTDMSRMVERAHESRDGHMPVLYVIGNIENDVTVDGTVIRGIGTVGGTRAYSIQPRAYTVLEGNDIKIMDDHPAYLRSNSEQETIDGQSIEMLIVANTATDKLTIPESATKTLVFPETKVPESDGTSPMLETMYDLHVGGESQ